MADIDDDKKMDLIYKNLEYVSRSYSTAEQVYPFWEAAFSINCWSAYRGILQSRCVYLSTKVVSVHRLYYIIYLVYFSQLEPSNRTKHGCTAKLSTEQA